MSYPKKEGKKKKKEPSPSLTSLPDDLLLSCLARVSRLYYRTLSFVSKRFRDLLASPELYKVRSLLDQTESCLYVCRKLYSPKDTCWFTLYRKPYQTQTNDTSKKSSGYVLATVPVPNPPLSHVSALVAVGTNIYYICKSESIAKPSRVSILDCMSHTWREAPSFPVFGICSFSASVLDEKIYVVGCYKEKEDVSFKNTFQILDTKTQIWNPMPIPWTGETLYLKSAFIDGKFHVKNHRGEVIAYHSKESRWDMVEPEMGRYMDPRHCVIENVLYSASHKGDLIWYDPVFGKWRNLKGLVGLPKLHRHHAFVRLVDYGGKMVVLWDKKYELWCAEITVEIRDICEIWGKVEWFDHVLTVEKECFFHKCFAATV